jgi:hypothetical protein
MLGISRRSAIAAPVAWLALAVLSFGTATASHVRPRGASPKFDELVIDYQPCQPPPASVHGGPATSPLSGEGSCKPQKESPFLTVGTPDVNGVGAQFIGLVKQIATTTPSPSDIKVIAKMTDIRCEPPIASNPALCVPNGPGPLAYQGETQLLFPIDVTDHCNYAGITFGPCPAPPLAGTVARSIVLRFTMPCTVPASTTGIGGTCSTVTTWNSVYAGIIPPPGPPANGSRMNIEVGQIHVSDGGPDGKVSTDDNRPFAIQGLFSP